MLKNGRMEITGGKVTFEEGEENDMIFWADKTPQERLAEMERLRRMIWTHILGKYPEKMELVGGFVLKSNLEEG